MIKVDEAKKIIIDNANCLGKVKAPLLESAGFVLAEDIISRFSLPPFNNSAMDGFAMRSSDTKSASEINPVRLRLIGESIAGCPFKRRIKKGEAVRIMTGAVIPDGADTVLMQEEAIQKDDSIEISRRVITGEHIRRRGEDSKKGKIALKENTPLDFQHLGILSALGKEYVSVYRAPRVYVIATGSELVKPHQRLTQGKLRNSNTPAILGLLKKTGIKAEDLGIVKDVREDLNKALKETMHLSDLIIISGGVSVGKYDLVKDVLCEMGLKTLFWKVKMKPGKPLLFGLLGKRLVFGIPGNPVSCAVCLIEFVIPAIRKIMKQPYLFNHRMRAVLKKSISKKDSRTHYITASLKCTSKGAFVSPTTTQGSGMLTSLAGANSFILLNEGSRCVSAGKKVEVILF